MRKSICRPYYDIQNKFKKSFLIWNPSKAFTKINISEVTNNMKNSHSNLISKKFLYLVGSNNEFGPSCTIMTEDKKLIQLDQKSEDLIDASLNFLGYDFKGAVRGAKSIVGNKKQCPIMLHPVHSICIFPHKSKRKKELYWFNLDYIDMTYPKGKDTEVEFSNGHTLLIDTHINNFKAKLQTAEQLKRVTRKRSL